MLVFKLLRDKIHLTSLSLGHLVATLQPILLVVILSRSLSIDEYGIYSRIIILSGLFQPFILFAYNEWYLREYFHNVKPDYILAQGTYLIFILVIIIFLIGTLIVHIFSLSYGDFFLGIVLSFSTSLLLLIRTHGVALGSGSHYLLFNSLVLLFVGLSLMIGLATMEIFTGTSVIKLVSLSFIVSYLFGLYFYKLKLRDKVDFLNLARAIKFLLPLVVFSVVALLSSAFDKYLATMFFDDKTMGSYYSHFQVSFGLSSLFSVVSMQWNRDVYKSTDSQETEIRSKFKKYVVFGLITSLIYFLSVPLIKSLLFPKSFHFTNVVIVFFHGGIMFQYMYMLYRPIIIHYGNRIELTKAAVLGLFGGLILNYILITQVALNEFLSLPISFCFSWLLIAGWMAYKVKFF